MPFSPHRREPHGGRRFKYEKYWYYCRCKCNKCVINNQAICVKLWKILSIWKYCTLLYMCAKIKFHTVNDVCKNYNRRKKIAHTPPNVQKQNCTHIMQCAKNWCFYEFCKQHIANDERNDVFKGTKWRKLPSSHCKLKQRSILQKHHHL